jgi:hypothetical protein
VRHKGKSGTDDEIDHSASLANSTALGGPQSFYLAGSLSPYSQASAGEGDAAMELWKKQQENDEPWRSITSSATCLPTRQVVVLKSRTESIFVEGGSIAGNKVER